MLKRYILLIGLISVLSGCYSTKKVRTITETITKIDTVIVVKKDTITLTNTVKLIDTAFIENSTSYARSYYDFGKQRMILELTGKTFKVPLTINQRTITDITTKEQTKKTSWLLKNSGLILFIGLETLLLYKFFK